jgi:hypothetical protein
MGNETQFFMSRLWTSLYGLSGVLFLLMGGLGLHSPFVWWRVLLSLLVAGYGAWWLYLAWRVRRHPMITVGESAIDISPAVTRKRTQVLRADVRDVAWFNPGSLGLRLNSGETLTINLIGLSLSDKAAVHELLERGKSG